MKITKKLVEKYLRGEANAEEVKAVQNALDNNQLNLDEWLPASEWHNVEGHPPFEQHDSIKRSLIKKVTINDKRQHIYTLLKYAAILLLVGTLGWEAIQYWKKSTNTPQIIAQLKKPATKPDSPSNFYYINSGNLPVQIDVPDGSKIELYPNSEVKFADNFSSLSTRDIHLKGKAKFAVAKDKSRPFNVYTKGLTTTALGTVFSIDEQLSSQTKVRLFEGRIRVKSLKSEPNSSPLHLEFMPNEEITIDHRRLQIIAEERMNSSKFNRRGFYAEKQNTLIFKNLALKDLLHIISQNYNVKLEFNSEAIEDKYYSGTYENNPSVFRKILSDIQELHHITITVPNKI